jgi:hypothetical protein
MLKRIGLTFALIAAMALTTAFAQAPTVVPLPGTRTRISFLPGTSAYTLTTSLTQGVSEGFVLRVAAGQSIFITKTGDAIVQVLDPQDTVVIGPFTSVGPVGVQAAESGDYTVVFYGQGQSTFTVYIPALGVGTRPPVPLPPYRQRIRFGVGATGYSFTPDLVQGWPLAFLLGITTGQQLDVSTQGNVTLALLDPQDNLVAPLAASASGWQFAIPQTGDYTIVLLGSGTVPISIRIPPLGQAGGLDTPQRISFAPGGTSASVQGTTATPGLDRFVIRALGGQKMMVSVSATLGPVILIIYGADGNVLISDHAGATTWSGLLPTTQDYFVDTRSVGDATVDFTLQVTIPPL